MEILNNDSFAYYVTKKVKKQFDMIDVDEDAYYSHPTYTISNLSEYISLIALVSLASDTLSQGDAVVFRGISDKDYDLSPGLARISNLHEDTEGNLINDFLTRRPDAFKDLNEFDIMAKMQHYGLPTRLLDFSVNPLVALYFACETSPTKAGRVLCHLSFLQNDKSEHVKAVCNSAVNKAFEENFTAEEYLCNENLSLIKFLREFYYYNETTIVRPKYWNQRIANQAGVFMVFPNNLVDKYMGIVKHVDSLGLENAIKEYGLGKTDNNVLMSILENENTDFYIKENDQYLTETHFKQMAHAYGASNKELFLSNIRDRFTLSKHLKMLSKETIAYQFCSIIIEGKHKKKILRDLSHIGIGADYIYPELEYTAREIKNQYI